MNIFQNRGASPDLAGATKAPTLISTVLPRFYDLIGPGGNSLSVLSAPDELTGCKNEEDR